MAVCPFQMRLSLLIKETVFYSVTAWIACYHVVWCVSSKRIRFNNAILCQLYFRCFPGLFKDKSCIKKVAAIGIYQVLGNGRLNGRLH